MIFIKFSSTLSSLLFVIYILLGPVPWLMLIALSIGSRNRLRRLEVDRSQMNSPPPRLAFVVPARNEEGGIVDCITRLKNQNYPGATIIVVNDRSTDSTGRLLDELKTSIAALKVIHLEQLPEGWLGKNHALHVGTRDLDVDWLMFVDSDVTLEPNAIQRLVAFSEERGYDAISLMPALDARSMLERTLLPLLAVAWGVMFRIVMTNNDHRPDHAFANGQLFLIRKTCYEKVGGHECVKDQIVEDVMLMRALKSSGARCRLLLGQSFARCRMHTNLKQMFHGWARIFAGSSQRRVMPILIALVFLIAQPVLLFGAISVIASTHGLDQINWLIVTGLHAMSALIFTAWCYYGARQRMLNVLWLPLTWPILIVIVANALRVCFTGRVDWRGNAVKVNR